MAEPVVFGDTVRTDPIYRKNARSCWQRPDNRNLYYILKSATDREDLFFQIREVGVGWGTEEEVWTESAGSISSTDYDFCFNPQSERMVIWRDWADGYIHTKFYSSDGATTIVTQHVSSGINTAGRPAVIALGPQSFRIAFAWDHDSDGTSDLYYRDFDGLTRTWGTLTSYGRPAGVVGVDGVRVLQSPVDGRVHYVVSARTSAFDANNLWYSHLSGVWEQFGPSSPGWPNSEIIYFDAQISYLDKEVMYVVAGDYYPGTPQTSTLRFYTRNDQQFWSEQVISNSAVEGANTPQIEINTNDDCYVVWKEQDIAGNTVSVWFRRRLNVTGVFESTIRVDDSLFNDPAGPTAIEDPDFPGIIRAPLGRGIREFCVTWGDDTVATGGDESHVFVTCADIPFTPDEPEDIPDTDLLRLNTIYVLDEPAGGPWARWRASTAVAAAQLNVTAWLSLDATKDDSELLWGTGEDNGTGQTAYVNELYSGYSDNGEDILFQYPTAIVDMSDPGIVKDFLYVDMRISTLGGAPYLEFLWDLDDGDRTGSFRVKVAGQHIISLPQVVGRVIKITPTETGQVAPPILQNYGLWWRPKGDKRIRRSEL